MIRKFFLAVAATLVSVTGLFAQGMQELPDDPAVRKGVLDNGMTYYIRHNDKPAGQAEFWIFDNVGALQEEDSQQGLAHFLEHMAFNGTENFPGKNMINYLESVGVKFGANLNAFTAQEMTCYNMSNVPIAREGVVDSALLVLHDWAYYIALEADEIDAERGVILNEMRTRNTADWRIHEQTGPYLYGDSRYATRNVIGHEEGLKTFPHDALRAFYHRWYRTDMQAILIVGDFDVDQMEQKVVKLMSSIPAVENPEPKAEIAVPIQNEEPIIGVLTDPELTSTEVALYIKREPVPVEFNKTPDVALMDMLDQFMMVIANERFSDIAQQPNAPFISGGMYSGYNIRPMDIVMIQASAREGEILTAFDAMYTEFEKMARYGFTQSEFDRAKTLLARQVQMAYDGRNDRRSEDFMWTYIYNYMLNKPMMSADDEYSFSNYLLEVINLDMLNQFVQARLTRENQVVIAQLPSKEGAVIPTVADFENIIETVQNSEIAPMADDFVAEPLIPAKTKLKGSKVVNTETDQFGATVWTLKNGATVIVKPTDFKADEVVMQVVGKGGESVLATEELMAAKVLPTYVSMSGMGKFNASDLRKQLTGKMVGIVPFVNTYTNGFSASASPKDLETMFQLLYLSFTAPRFDATDYDVMMSQLRAAYGNVVSDPQFKLEEVMTETMYGNNPRREMLTFDQLDNISFEKIQQVYDKLYSNPDDFTYLIVGNVDLETLKPMVEKYIGSLPKTKKEFTMVDDGVRYAQGKVVNHFTMPMQMPKASVVTILNGEMPYTLENRLAMDFFAQLLTIRYTETMREEKGGTYGVAAFGQISFLPNETYLYLTMFDTEPAMVDDLKQDITNEIEKMAAGDVREEDMVKIKEYFAKQYPDQIKQNGYWRNILMYYHLYGYDLDSNYLDVVNGFDAAYFQKLAAKILADGNLIEVIMTPAEATETECAE